MADSFYRVGLAALHTQTARNAQGKQVMGVFADYAGKSYDDLPFLPGFLEHGITKKDWERFSAVPLHKVGGATFLRPIDLFQSVSSADKKAAERFSNFMQDYIRTAVLDPSLRTRRAVGEAIDPNSREV